MEPLQPRLFHDVITDAMHTDIAACGGAEKAAEWMLPHLGPKAGGDMVRAFVNPDRRERMTPEQLLLLKRKAAEVGSYATVTFEAQELGYQPQWLDPQDEADELRRAVRDLLKVVNQRLERIERVESRASPAKGRR